MTLHLRGTFSNNARVRPLLEGIVKPRDIEIDWEIGQPAELHERHLRDDAFDVFEFSISHYMTTVEHPSPDGKWDWAALPIFLSKGLLCLGSLKNVNAS